MPGDQLVARPTCVTNRAITIHARPERVWPWLAQTGELPRGALDSHEWFERLMRTKVEKADPLLPGAQDLGVGQAIGRAGDLRVEAVEPGRHLVLGLPPRAGIAATRALALYADGDDSTRLVSRVRTRIERTPGSLFRALLLDPGRFLMERKMLLGIKKQAEAGSRPVISPGRRFALHG